MSPVLLRRFIKPSLFLLCLLPLLSLVARAFELGGSNLGTNPFETIQNSTGQWALRLLVITLAITPLRDWFNATWLIQLRRMLGLFAFSYVVLHFAIWLLDQGFYWQGILTDIGKRPYITIGFVALVLLIPLAVTSTNGMMRRLGRRWKTLHRLVYPITLLGVWHYYWQVKKDVTEPLIYLGIVMLLLGWRVWKRWRPVVAKVANAG